MNLDDFLQLFENVNAGTLLSQFLYFLLWTAFILLLMWAARKAINKTISDNTSRYHARKVTRLTGYFLILLLAIVSFTGKVQYFTLTIGLLSAGIAFALQEVILSVAGWVSIFANGLYKPGDRIELNQVKGDVIDVGVTKTTLMEIGEWVNSDNYTGRMVQISNAFVFKQPVYNYSRDFPFLWDEIILPVRYGSDVEVASQLILKAASDTLGDYADFAEKHWKEMVKKYLIENAHVEPALAIRLTDNWIEFNLRYVVDYKKRRSVKHLLFDNIRQAVEATGGKVQLASATFEVVGVPPLKVDVKRNE